MCLCPTTKVRKNDGLSIIINDTRMGRSINSGIIGWLTMSRGHETRNLLVAIYHTYRIQTNQFKFTVSYNRSNAKILFLKTFLVKSEDHQIHLSYSSSQKLHKSDTYTRRCLETFLLPHSNKYIFSASTKKYRNDSTIC